MNPSQPKRSESPRKKQFYDYFQAEAKAFSAYRRRFTYYWNDIGESINYFIHEEDSVLEVGCGVGRTISQLKGRNKTGIDFSPAMVAEAKTLFPDIRFEVMDAEDITLEEQFDVIVLSNCIGFFDDVLQVFKQLKRVSHPRTRIIINYYNYIWEPVLNLAEKLGIKKRTLKQNWLSRADISNLLYLAGLENYRATTRLLIPIYIPLLSWVVNKFIARLPLFNAFCINQLVFARWHSNEPFGESPEYKTSVVIPARNESGNIEDAILRLPDFGREVEIIFIEGNSTDDTWQKIQEVQAKYPQRNIVIGQQDGKGKGNAVRKGFAMATGDILMIL
ncbi:MAG: methyltransferase domain-containing protein, partial [Cytophagales bacterium]|nr:methyltransferase domain-containing protein [Cytophagales bacterium]